MPRKAYQKRLEGLRGDVGAMADLTLDRYEQAVSVLSSGDPDDARSVIEGDADINEWYLDLENGCIELLALQQPVASDLRFVASSFKIATDLERIGDLATNLARYGRETDGERFAAVDVEPIATEAGAMVADAMDAYARNDADAARAVAARDDDLDEQCKQASDAVMRELLRTDREDEELDAILDGVSRALLTIRDLERVGDHAANIAARTLYMVENDDELIY